MSEVTNQTFKDKSQMIADVLKVISDYGYEVTDADAAYVKGYLACLQIKQQSES